MGASAAKTHLPSLLAQVEKGAEIVITRRGHPVARLVPIDAGFDRVRARRVADGLRAASRGQTLDGLPIAALVAEGRR